MQLQFLGRARPSQDGLVESRLRHRHCCEGRPGGQPIGEVWHCLVT